ncbi:hypothetical protein ESOMN_v1c03700 [Williamsoniiplasma somnilux]|uniref:HTH marR-type domain-containing protein n=1 Tax=Williamsoniiplasma somnilux TaxID=215578 RepID=A0A2K8NY48_9MOLU|nr:MarR family winged helix-turn-helix transcriptional regulator [Williamsoniiplasma somnilux]ATZ18752.1 hypothetical protein ESOMN_v1c03700 [Williamsoniiplasma somnilux]
MIYHENNEFKDIPTVLKIYMLVINTVKFLYSKIDPQNLDKISILTLMLIYHMPGINQNKVANTLNIDKTTTGRILSKLEEEKYIERVQDKNNKRSNVLRTIEKADQLIEKIAKTVDEYVKNIEDGLTDEEILKLREVVNFLLKNSIKLAR